MEEKTNAIQSTQKRRDERRGIETLRQMDNKRNKKKMGMNDFCTHNKSCCSCTPPMRNKVHLCLSLSRSRIFFFHPGRRKRMGRSFACVIHIIDSKRARKEERDTHNNAHCTLEVYVYSTHNKRRLVFGPHYYYYGACAAEYHHLFLSRIMNIILFEWMSWFLLVSCVCEAEWSACADIKDDNNNNKRGRKKKNLSPDGSLSFSARSYCFC